MFQYIRRTPPKKGTKTFKRSLMVIGDVPFGAHILKFTNDIVLVGVIFFYAANYAFGTWPTPVESLWFSADQCWWLRIWEYFLSTEYANAQFETCHYLHISNLPQKDYTLHVFYGWSPYSKFPISLNTQAGSCMRWIVSPSSKNLSRAQ